MTKATPQVVIKDGPEAPPIITAILPGRRALGETWSKVSVRWEPDERAYVLTREDAEAPADNSPIFVPALGNLSMEAVDFIVQQQQEESKHRARNNALTREQREKEQWDRLNRLWQDFAEQKLKHFRNQSQIGPGGMTQRSS